MNKTVDFFNNVQNMTGEDQPLTKVELTALEKLINTTKVRFFSAVKLNNENGFYARQKHILNNLSTYLKKKIKKNIKKLTKKFFSKTE